MEERNIIMKNVKKIISAMLSGTMALTICAGTALNVSAVEVYEEREMLSETYNEANWNDTINTAETIPVSLLYDETYYMLRGNFTTDTFHTDRRDFYKFHIGKTTGHNGRVAIRLDSIASGNNFDLYLYDANQNLIASSKRTGNQKDIVKTPEITSYTDYFLEVRAETITNASTLYNIFVEDYYFTTTKTVKLSPSTLNATPDKWSADAYRDMTSYVNPTAVVTKAKISATKSKSSGGYNHVIRVKLNKNDDYVTVSWNSGAVEIPGLVGKNAYGTWYAGFKASELPQMIGGKPTYLGIVALSDLTLEVTYDYQIYTEYEPVYNG